MYCQTEWAMKIDTDAVCLGPSNWPDPDWFDTGVPWIAPKWHYTKGRGFLKRLDDWGDGPLSNFQRLNIPQEADDQLRVGHSRMCSWLSFYRVDYMRWLVTLLKASGHEATLPVPSQDTFAWYVAARAKMEGRVANMKAHRWTNCSKMSTLIDTVQAVMRGDMQGAIADG
jgi:hypothetical protein